MYDPKGLAGISRYISSSSALNPALLLSLICTPISFTIAYLGIANEIFSYSLMLFGAAPPAVAIWQIIKFTNADPDRLQNDKHVENKMLISRIGANSFDGTYGEIIIDRSEPSENPLLDRGDDK